MAANSHYQSWEYADDRNSSVITNNIPHFGLYSTNFTTQRITPRTCASKVISLNKMLNKNWYDLAILNPLKGSKIKFFNGNFFSTWDSTQNVNNQTVRDSTGRSGAAIVSSSQNGIYVFVATDTSTFFITTKNKIKSIDAGYFNSGNGWVKESSITPTYTSTGFKFKITPYQCLRLTFPTAKPSVSQLLQ